MRFRPLSRGAIAGVASVAVLGVGGAVLAATQLGSSGPGGLLSTDPGPAATTPVVRVVGLHHGRVPWDRPVRLHSRHGTFDTITVTRRDGTTIPGRLSGNGRSWASASHLVPLTRYVAHLTLADTAGDAHPRTLRFAATDASKHLTATLSPGDNDTVGVGSPVIVSLSRPVPDGKRADVERRLAVSTTPSVVGAWHWMSPQVVHWRPPTYWKAHTTVTVTSDLDGLYVGSGVWGVGHHQTTFKIGDSHISRVDGARHQMYVYNNGKLVKTFPISAGRTQYPTKSGVHITFEKSQVVTMDSATVGIPRDSPDGYYEQVYWDVRISYGGAFVHAAPWSVAEQGISNVSHGCVNVATDNAIWFYNFSLRGDIVDVYNTGAPPDTADPGMADWNMPWKQWLAGSAAPTADAKAIHPRLPRDAEPRAPGGSSPSTASSASPSPSSYHSPSPSPSSSPKPRHTHH
jgi:lipoprotein-anchoring transpeptidase ErfK/SrfK